MPFISPPEKIISFKLYIISYSLSSCASVESVLDAQFYATALLKYSQMRQHLLRFCLALTQNCSIENSLNLKQDKIVVFQGGRSMEYSRISRPTTQKNGYFTCFRRVRHWCNCLSKFICNTFLHKFFNILSPAQSNPEFHIHRDIRAVR